MKQATLAFEPTEAPSTPESEEPAANLPPPPGIIRPERQLTYPDALTHWAWPDAKELHDADTITIDCVRHLDNQSPESFTDHRFVIKTGDTVRVGPTERDSTVGTVTGVDHERHQVRVATQAGSEGVWHGIGTIRPTLQQGVAEPEHVATTTSLPPPFVRPDRQTVFPDALTHYDWPAPEHDRDTITVDRVVDSLDGEPAHRFTIKRGDTVRAHMRKDDFHTGTVIGISHARTEVRVSYGEDASKGGWWKVGAIYPEPEPTPSSHENVAPLSAVVEKLNDEKAPPGGWGEQHRVPTPYSFAEFKELLKRNGEHESFAKYRSDFERLVSSKTEITSELQSDYKAPQLKAVASRFGEWNARSNTKQANAESIYRKMLSYYVLDGMVSYSMGESYTEAVKKKVLTVTEQHWSQHYADARTKRDEHDAAIANPQTLYDFRLAIEANGVNSLTNEQLARWDALHADLARERRAQNGPSNTVTQFESDEVHAVEFTVKEGYHDKRECPLWIVQLGGRVDPATFKELKTKARMLDGWWSSFKKSDAGFQFLTEDAASRFTALLDGDADRRDVLENRQSRKEQTTAERLHGLADEMLARSEETIARSDDSLQNTARRASIQAGVRGQAHAQAAMARSLHSVAEALSKGDATYLDGLRHRTHLQELDRTLYLAKWSRIRSLQKQHREGELDYNLRLDEEEDKPFSEDDIRHAEFPFPTVYVRNLREVVTACENKKGLKQLSTKIARQLRGIDSGEDFVTYRNANAIEQLSDFLSRAKAAGVECERISESVAHYQRLQRARIGDIHELRAALREYLPHKACVRGDDPVRIAERELIGKDLPGFFPTPESVISEMLEYAGIADGHRVLEPSAGKGDIYQAIEREHPGAVLTAIEMNRSLAEVLSAKGIEADFGDFLEHTGEYDRIVMNPPFEKGADIDHVRYAYDLLGPAGRLVSVVSEGPFYRSDSKAKAFRDWLDVVGGFSIELPENAFAGADSFRQTGVRTRLVTIEKEAT